MSRSEFSPVSRQLAAVLVAVVVFGGCTGESEEPTVTATSSSSNPLSKGDQPPPGPPIRSRKLFEVDLPGTQPRWDPRKVDALPAAPAGTVADLPAAIEPPAVATPLVDAPIGAAILAVNRREHAFLLSTDGEWRTISLAGRYAGVDLNPSGTRALVLDGDIEEDPVTVVDLASGNSRTIAYPTGYRGWDYSGWRWLEDDSLLLTARRGSWLINAVTGAAEHVRYPGDFVSGVDNHGVILESADWHRPRIFSDWRTVPPHQVSMRDVGRLMHVFATHDTVVGTSYDGHPFAVIVADRKALAPQAVLPVLDFEGNYSPGALRPIALRDDGTVLLKVSVFGRHIDGFRVVSWDPESGDLSIVSTTSIPIEQSVSFADGLLRRTDP